MAASLYGHPQNPQYALTEKELADIERRKRLQHRFEAEVSTAEKRIGRLLSADELLVIRKQVEENP